LKNSRTHALLAPPYASSLLRFGLPKWEKKTLIYLDPPYYEQGRELYYDYYKPDDHSQLAKFIEARMENKFWIVSYDNVAPIKRLYSGFRSVVYNVGYTAREMRVGKEVMFFPRSLIFQNSWAD